jgi:uncharacterized RDD family membrane protein YckC
VVVGKKIILYFQHEIPFMNNEMQTDQPSDDLLSDLDIPYQDASTGQRFLNYFIDNVFMRLGLTFITTTFLGFVLQFLSPGFLQYMAQNDSGLWLFVIVVVIFNYVMYYTLCEKLFNGYTLGKLITGTRAIRADGKPLTFKDSLLRSLSRIVPFEAFSGFGVPWHDAWTNTRVIKSR